MTLNQVTVSCTDLAASVAFYRGLGLHQIVSSPPDYARFECPLGGSTFSLHRRPEPSRDDGVVVYFEIEDLDGRVSALQRAGFEFDTEPRDQPWLWREAYLRDPAGNRICLFRAGVNRRYPPWRMRVAPVTGATLVPCRDDAECEKLGAFLADRIYEFNAKATGYDDGMLLAGSIRNDAGDIVAGFNGHTWGGCCELSHVWVDERYRGQGLGSVLLRSAEAEAVARGCAQVVLATHSFQAPGFYERMGYEKKYAIEGRPKGYADIIYVKVLQASPASALS